MTFVIDVKNKRKKKNNNNNKCDERYENRSEKKSCSQPKNIFMLK